jgi:hypothetical protein
MAPFCGIGLHFFEGAAASSFRGEQRATAPAGAGPAAAAAACAATGADDSAAAAAGSASAAAAAAPAAADPGAWLPLTAASSSEFSGVSASAP